VEFIVILDTKDMGYGIERWNRINNTDTPFGEPCLGAFCD